MLNTKMQSSLIRLPGKPLVCEDWGFGERCFKTEMSLGFQPGYFVCVSEYTHAHTRRGMWMWTECFLNMDRSVSVCGYNNGCVCNMDDTGFVKPKQVCLRVCVYSLKIAYTLQYLQSLKLWWSCHAAVSAHALDTTVDADFFYTFCEGKSAGF